MPIKFIAFGDWAPDAPEYGEVALHKAENVLPVYGAYRPLRKKNRTSIVVDGPVLGALAHHYQRTLTVQYARPDGDDSPGAWARADFAQVSGDLFSQIDEVTVSDTSRIYSPGEPSASAARFSLGDPTTPGSTAGHILHWRYAIENSTGAWTVKTELMEGSTVRATDSATGSGDVTWIQRDHALTTGEAGAIGDFTNLFIRFTATVAGAAQQDARPTADISLGGWTDQSGGGEVWDAINESSPADTDYAQSPALAPGDSAVLEVSLGAIIDPLVLSDQLTAVFRGRAINDGVGLLVQLFHGSTEVGLVSSLSPAPTAFATTSNAPAGDPIAITDYADLRLRFTASYPLSVPSTVSQFGRPVGDVFTGNWTTLSGGLPLWSAIDEAVLDLSDKIKSVPGPPGTDFLAEVAISPLVDPRDHTKHTIRINGQCDSGTCPITVALVQQGRVCAVTTLVFTAGAADYSYTLAPSEVSQITDYAALSIRLIGGSTTRTLFVSQLYFEAPQPRRIQISYADLVAHSAARAGISWFEYELPSALSTFQGDATTIYAGTKAHLYEVTGGTWTNRSKSGGYATGTINSVGWRGWSWGEDVHFTNKVDPVQSLTAGGSAFADLITAPSPAPKARFGAPVREQVWLGDINLTGHYSDEVWWSATDDATNFTPSATTLSDIQRLRQTPGQVMGLVGGQQAVIFKRTSMILGTWVGAPQIYSFSVLSSGVGTPYPSSIVTDAELIYFRAADNFYRWDPSNGIQVIGDKVLCKFLKDAKFSPSGIIASAPLDPRDEDQLVVGARCASSRLIVWTYQSTGDEPYKHSHAVVYDPGSERWSLLSLPSRRPIQGPVVQENMTRLVSKSNVSTDQTHVLRGILGFDWDGANSASFQWDGDTTYSATLETKIQTVIDGRAIRIIGIRPIFTAESAGGDWPFIHITTSSGRDSRLIDNVQVVRKSTIEASSNGWLGWMAVGEFWRFTVEIPELTLEMLKEFVGVAIRYQEEQKA